MLFEKHLYINLGNNNPETRLVRSPSNLTPDVLGAVVAGDTWRLVIHLLDGTGAYSTRSGDPAIQVTAGIGGLGSSALVYSANFVATGSYYSGSMNLNTGSLLTALGTEDVLDTFLELQLKVTGSAAPDSGSVFTPIQSKLKVRNQIIPN